LYAKINMDIDFDDIINFDEMDIIKKTKVVFIFNALEKGWTIKKKGERFLFSKNHEGKKEVFSDEYLKRFIKTNLFNN